MSKGLTPEQLAAQNAINYTGTALRARALNFAQMTGTEFVVRTQEIPVGSIIRSPYQPRLIIDQEHIETLAESIKASRQIEPILVRQTGEQEYELIAGEHRWEAIKLLGRDTILATIRQISDGEAEIAALVDNIKHKGITDYEAGRKFAELIENGKVASPSEMARIAGIARQTVYRCVTLAKLPKEITSILDDHPDAIGGHAGETIDALIKEGFLEQAVAAVNAVIAGSLKQKEIDSWVRSKAKAQAAKSDPVSNEQRLEATKAPRIVCADDRISGRVVTKGNKIRFDVACDKALPPETVAKIEEKLREMLAQLTIPEDPAENSSS